MEAKAIDRRPTHQEEPLGCVGFTGSLPTSPTHPV